MNCNRTKNGRLEMLNSIFENQISSGYEKTTYKDVVFFTKKEDEKYLLNVYVGSSTKQLCKYYYKTPERRQIAIDEYKKSANYRENRKNEPRNKSNQAQAAAAIRAELKNKFPEIKFSVTSDGFSMGDSVHIGYEDGVIIEEVENITDKYQYGHFDGMTDMYEFSNNRDDIPQSKYVSVSRKISDKIRGEIMPFITEIYNSSDTWKQTRDTRDENDLFYRLMRKTTIPKNAVVLGIEKTDCQCGQFEDFYKVSFKEIEVKEGVQKTSLNAENFELIESIHSKYNYPIWIVKVLNRVNNDEFSKLLETAKTFNGYYSSYRLNGAIPGFIFKTEQKANEFLSSQSELSIEKTTIEKTEVEKAITKNNDSTKNALIGEKWAKLAESYKSESDKKYSELKNARSHTPKQNREYNSKRVDAEILQDVSILAFGLAESYKNNTIPDELKVLQPIKSKNHLFPFVAGHESDGYYDSHRGNVPYFTKSETQFPNIEGINSRKQADKILELLNSLNLISPDELEKRERENRIKKLEDNFKFQKIAGFFPTPDGLIERMIDNLKITNGQTILEPSAGLGNIAEKVKETFPNNKLHTVEVNYNLSEILRLKGFENTNEDFLNFTEKFDRIIMNPPFEKAQDIDHVKHAFDLLEDNGRIVSIMSSSAFHNSTKKHVDFKEWIDNLGAEYYPLPENSFKDAFKSTGVNTYLLIIDK